MLQRLKGTIGRFWYLFFLFLVIGLLISFDISVIEIRAMVSELGFFELIFLVIIFLTISMVHILSKKYLLHSLGEQCRYFNLVMIHFSSMAAHYTTPVKIGYPVTVYLLKKFENIQYEKSTALISVELIVSTYLCLAISLIGATDLVYDSIGPLNIILLALTPVLIIFIIYKTLAKFQANILSRFFARFISHLMLINLSKLTVYTGILCVIRVLDGFSLYMITFFYTEQISLWQSIIATSSAFLIGAISMVPMGLGTRDLSLFAFLVSFDLTEGAALGIITLQRILSTGLGFLIGIFFVGISGVRLSNSLNGS